MEIHRYKVLKQKKSLGDNKLQNHVDSILFKSIDNQLEESKIDPYETTSTRNVPKQLQREGTLLAQLSSLISPVSFDTTYLTHGMHPYPAKYIPQLPNLVIREHTNARNTVLDPFCGSGTTLLEATLLGRKSVGIDSNPIAALISQAKTTALNDYELDEAEILLSKIKRLSPNKKNTKIPGAQEVNLEHWFQPHVTTELDIIRKQVNSTNSMPLRNFLRCVFSSIIVSVSNQESETRYAAINKKIDPGDTFKRFCSKLERELVNIRLISSLNTLKRNTPQVYLGDIRNAASLGISENFIDLVVTSPPYPNSFDYYLYHKWRLFWLGYDFRQVMASEIGSRNEHSSKKQPIDSYIAKMHLAMEQICKVLKPSKLAYFFVGDAVIAGELFNIADTFRDIIKDLDLQLIADTNYSLEAVTRSFHEKKSSNCHGGRRNISKRSHVLVFEKVNRSKISFSSTRQKATPNPTSIAINLCSPDKIINGQIIALESKDSSRHIHSLGRYPSKFIPDIPRWAITNFSNVGDTIFDPFSGSGTTAVEAITHSRNSIASDISKYSCLLTEAKAAVYDPLELKAAAGMFLLAIESGFPGIKSSPAIFPLSDFWFNSSHLIEIAKCCAFINKAIQPQLRPFMFAVLSTIIRPCSFQDEGQIKVKRDPRKVLHGTPSPFELLPSAINKAVEKKIEFLSIANQSSFSQIIHASADDLLSNHIPESSVDLIVTSPPYVNAMNYPMTHRYENIILGLLSAVDKNQHEKEYFGSERVYSADYSKLHQLPIEFERAKELNQVLAEIYKREPKRSFIAYRFFSKMNSTIKGLSKILRSEGKFVLVCGRNTIRGIPLDTFGYLKDMIEANSFTLIKSFEYEIIKNAFKLTRHSTADIIKTDGVAVLEKTL